MEKAAKKLWFLRKQFLPTPLFLIMIGDLISRIPNLFEPYWYGDEAIYLAIGVGLRQGELLYRDIFDHKPPLIYILSALTGSLIWFKLLLLIWHILTVVIFWKFAEKIISSSSIKESDRSKAMILSTLLFTVFTTLPMLEGNIVNAEILMVGPILLGFLMLWGEKKVSFGKYIFSGLIFAYALLLKIPSALDILALFIFWGFESLWNLKKIGQTISKSFLVGIGILLPFVLITIYFWQQKALLFYLQGVISQNIGYVSSWATPQVGAEAGGLAFRVEVTAVILLLLLIFKKFFDRTTLFLSIWFTLTLFAALLSGRPYPHYLLQVIAPLSLILANLVFGKFKYRFLPLPIVGLFLGSLLFYKFYYYPTVTYYKNFALFATRQETFAQYASKFDSRMPNTYEIAQYLADHTNPNDRIFIWGTEPEIYALSRHVPPGRYITSFHIIDFNGQGETIASLEKNPPIYILNVLSEKRNLDRFDKILHTKYVYVSTMGNIEIWKKMDINMAKIKRY